MIDGDLVVAVTPAGDYHLYEAMKDLAQQFADGGMTIDDFLIKMLRLAEAAERKQRERRCVDR